ncbi:MAG: hypothetical protein HUK26_02920, partial [Duodenibacillus sp.]|nr:hypothetical protein [Duodenibacillus sp.]
MSGSKEPVGRPAGSGAGADPAERIALALERIARSLEEISARLPAQGFAAAEAAPEEEDPVLKVDGRQFLIDFLRERQIALAADPGEPVSDQVLLPVARLMGSRFANIQRLYGFMKQTLGDGRHFWVAMKYGFSKEDIAYSTQLCSMLSNLAMLAEYK